MLGNWLHNETDSVEMGIDAFGHFLEEVEEIRMHRRPLSIWDPDAPPKTGPLRIWRTTRYESFDRRDAYTAEQAIEDISLMERTDWELGTADVTFEDGVHATTFEATIEARYDQIIGSQNQPRTAEISYSGIVDADRPYQQAIAAYLE